MMCTHIRRPGVSQRRSMNKCGARTDLLSSSNTCEKLPAPLNHDDLPYWGRHLVIHP